MKDLTSDIERTVRPSGIVKAPEDSGNNTRTAVAKLRIQSFSTPTYCGGSITIPSGIMDRSEFDEARKLSATNRTGPGSNISGKIVLDWEVFMNILYGAPHMYLQVRTEDAQAIRDFLKPDLKGIQGSLIVDVVNGEFTTLCIDSAIYYEDQAIVFVAKHEAAKEAKKAKKGA